MAIQDTFYWNGERYYGQEELSLTWDCFFYAGVRVKDDGTVDYEAHTSGNNIIINADSLAYLGGVFRYEQSQRSISASGNSGTRYLTIQADYGNRTADLKIVSNAIPVRNSSYYELHLYQLNCTGSAVTIVNDLRSQRDFCGYCTAKERGSWMAYFEQWRSRVEDWFDTQQGNGWRKIFYQNESPSRNDVVDGSMWFDRDNGKIFVWRVGAWEEFSLGKSTESQVYSVIATTQTQTNISGPEALVPFTHDRQYAFDPSVGSDNRHNYHTFRTSYCHLMSTGECYIDEDGVYAIDCTINVTNTNGIEKFQMGLWLNKYNSVNGGPVLLSENFVVKAVLNNAASGSMSCVIQLKANDRISAHCTGYVPNNANGDQTTRQYAIHGRHTHMTVYKLSSL